MEASGRRRKTYGGLPEQETAQQKKIPRETQSVPCGGAFSVWKQRFDIYEVREVFGSSAFRIPTGTTVIEANAFEGIGAASVIVPKECTEIEDEAFRDCLNLRKILLPLDCDISDTAFDGCTDLIIYAPAGGETQAWAERNGFTFYAEERP